MRNKNLFTGAAGRFEDQGGARMYTTPNTIYVPPEYEIDAGISDNDKDNFVTCSLDGRLWVFGDKIIVLKWNKNARNEVRNKNGKIEFVKSITLNNETVIARGIDWILTNKSIIKAYDNIPYVYQKKLYKDGSAINYVADNIEKFYSFLPVIDKWIISPIGFILIPSETPDETLEKEPYLYPCSFIEFNYQGYGILWTLDKVYLTYHDKNIWGRGQKHIGKVTILPSILNEDNEPEGFYIYIGADYKFQDNNKNIPDNWNWKNIALASIVSSNQKHLYGLLCQNINTLDEGLCQASDDLKIFHPETNNYETIKEDDGKIYFDSSNFSGLAVYEEGIKFLNDKSYSCNALSQWISPAEKMDSVVDNTCVSVVNEHDVLVTHAQNNFYRELLPNKLLPLTSNTYSKQKLSLGINDDNKIEANTIEFPNEIKNEIRWEDIYKNPWEIKIKEVNNWDSKIRYYCPSIIEEKTIYKYCINWIFTRYDPLFYDEEEDVPPFPEVPDGTSIDDIIKQYKCEPIICLWPTGYEGKVAYIDIDTAKMEIENFFLNVPSKPPPKNFTTNFGIFTSGGSGGTVISEINGLNKNNMNEVSINISTVNDESGLGIYEEYWGHRLRSTYLSSVRINYYQYYESEMYLMTGKNSNWIEYDEFNMYDGNSENNLIGITLNNVYDSCAIFRDVSSGLLFRFRSPLLKKLKTVRKIYNFSKKNTYKLNYKNEVIALKNAHIVIMDNEDSSGSKCFVLYSELKKEIFNIDQEIKKSKFF